MHVLTFCGSLRARSSNQAILGAFRRLAPKEMTFEHFEGLGGLPHFNPDLCGEARTLPPEVAAWQSLVANADAVVISTPEYAHGLPGTFKNALDWLVGGPAFLSKRIVILSDARGSNWAQESLREVLRTMSATLIESADASLPLGSNQLDENAILARDDLRSILLHSIQALLAEFNKSDLHQS